MPSYKPLRFGRALFLAWVACCGGPWAQAAEEALRAEVAKPLLAAQEALKAGHATEALARVRDAEAVAGRTEYETFITNRTKGAVAVAAKDNLLALKAFEAVAGAGRLPPAEQLSLLKVLPTLALKAEQPQAAVRWARLYLTSGGTDRAVSLSLVQALFNLEDYAASQRELLPLIQAEESAGRKPAEAELKLLGLCQLKTQDDAGYYGTLQRLVTHHPAEDYWADLLPRLQRQPAFDARLQLDALRLMRHVGVLQDAEDHLDMAQLSLRAGLPGEALSALEEGFAKGLLGKGAGAPNHQRLLEAARKAARTDDAQFAAEEARARKTLDSATLANLGLAMVAAGQADKGLALMALGIDKGTTPQPDHARFRLGVALLAHQRRAEAEPLLKGVRGNDGAGDLARLWLVAVR
jgi:hypothetical protein